MEDFLQQLSDKVWVIQGKTNTGIIKLNERHCLIIDPGQNRASARAVMDCLKEIKLEIAGVFLTHSHADHFGGTNYLNSSLKMEYFASEFESHLIEQPVLEPIFLFGGAEPIDELTHEFIMAQPVRITKQLPAGKWIFAGTEFNIINLPGHSKGQIGLQFEEFFFGGDAITLRKFIEKYKFPLYSDIGQAFSTFDYLLKTTYGLFIPGHGQLLTPHDCQSETNFNRDYLRRFIGMLLENLRPGPLTAEEILQKMATQIEAPLVTVIQYVLNRTIVLAILKYLQNENLLCSYFENSRWLWRLC